MKISQRYVSFSVVYLASFCFMDSVWAEENKPVEVVKPVEAADFIDVFHKTFGDQKGFRKAHAKGVCATGEFIPSPDATKYFKAALFSVEKVPVVYRFSLSSGNALAPDYLGSVRGLAAQFILPNGSNHMLASLSVPMFGAKNLENFLGLLKVSIPGADGKPDLEKVKAFREAHPDTQIQAKWVAENPPPESYNHARYHGLHTFYLADFSDKKTKIRWHLEPKDGVKNLSAEEITQKNNEFLNDRLKQRLSRGVVEFDWVVTIGKEEDTEIDPSAQWPDDREKVNVGTLKVLSAGEDSCNNINFNPNVLSDGFSPSEDPILKIRSVAYAISLGKRLSGQ